MSMPGQPRILVVDDEDSVRSLLQKVLRKNGYEATVASNGQQALDCFRTQDFELALLDIGLPDISGMDLLEQISGEFPGTTVLMATGLADVDVAVESMKRGADDYLTKPFNIDDMLIRVEKALERRYLAVLAKDYHHKLEERVSDQSEQLQSMTTKAVRNLMHGFAEEPEPAIAEVQERNREQASSLELREFGSWIFRRFGVGTR